MALKLLLDLDPGIDDALALDHALSQPGFELLAVTTTFGSVPVAQATRNALLLCTQAGHPDLPVCMGMAEPLRKTVLHHEPQRQGQDGLGDLPWPSTSLPGADERSAARCIVQLARTHPGELCVVTGGPLGNLAQALRLEPHLPELLRQVIVGGGSIAAPGDASPVAELNFWHDPHAADLVLSSGLKLALMGLDVSEAAPIPLDLIERRLASRPPALASTLRHAARQHASYRLGLNPQALPACPSATLLGLLWLQDPGLFHTETGCVRVVTDSLAEGQSIMDRYPQRAYPQSGWEADRPTIQAALSLDRSALLALLEPAIA